MTSSLRSSFHHGQRRSRYVGGVLLILLLVTSPLAGQAVATRPQPHPILPTAIGLLFGAAGFLGGGLVGMAIECDNDCDESLEGLAGFVFGGTLGEALLLPVGVHLGNGGRGNLAADLGVSTTVAAATLAGAAAFGGEGMVIAGILGQLALTVITERHTAASRMRAGAWQGVSFGVRASGDYSVGVNLAF